LKIINENNMVGEDYRSAAYTNYHKFIAYRYKYNENLDLVAELK